VQPERRTAAMHVTAMRERRMDLPGMMYLRIGIAHIEPGFT
jgi:hypothetical protein